MQLRQILLCVSVISALQSVCHPVFAQNTDTQRLLRVNDDQDDTDLLEYDSTSCCRQPKKWSILLSADGGGTNFIDKQGGKNLSSSGLLWAIGGNVYYNLSACSSSISVGVSAGLEVRNYNAIISSSDRFNGKAYDNLHYWYAGLPIMFHISSNPDHCNGAHCENTCCKIGYYAQGGVIVGLKLYHSNYYSLQGENFNLDISDHYQDFTYQPVISAGIKCSSESATYMIGPFVTYTPNNILNHSGLEERLLGYGLRLSVHFDR